MTNQHPAEHPSRPTQSAGQPTATSPRVGPNYGGHLGTGVAIDDLRLRPRAADISRFLDLNAETRIATAIAAAEAKTAGEIVAVVTPDSAAYTYVPFLYAGLLALLVPMPLIFLTWWPIQWIYALQLLVFAATVLALWSPRIRLKLVPRQDQINRAHARAVEQFLTQNMHTTAARTGVLIFVSVAERYAEIIADTGIHSKVPPERWQAIVNQLTGEIGAGRTADGFVGAITECGALLAKHFPQGRDEPRGLPNHLIVLR